MSKNSNESNATPRPPQTAAPGALLSRPADQWVPALVKALTRQCELCRSLDTLSAKQSEQIRSGDSDGLLRVLAERQGFVDQVAELNDQIAPYRQQWETCLAAAGKDDRVRLEMLVNQLTDLVERIARQDDVDRAALEIQRSALSTELGGVIRGRGAVAAYNGAGAATNQPRFQDQNG
ncbi:MAG: flagellar export chaperone FlgN [Pyrinomonadaceae bacterium]|nr:flagellar export chaperone FlgN [Phycisphaerales bacterium]